MTVEEGTTLLEAARFLGIPIPTLCHMDGLTPYGACRLCVVEIGEGPKARLVSACTYPAEEGLRVRTGSARVMRARKMVLELLLASCPQSKVIQDLRLGLRRAPAAFPAGARGLHPVRSLRAHVRGADDGRSHRIPRARRERSIGTPFDARSEVCRLCGGCMYVCPACQLRCTYTEPDKAICGGCANLSPPCLEKQQFDDMMCYMTPCVACEIQREDLSNQRRTIQCHFRRVNPRPPP